VSLPADARTVTAVRAAYDWLDDRVAEVLRDGARAVSCKVGCDACCHYPLRVSSWEMETVADACARLPQLTRRRVHKQVARALRVLEPLRGSWKVFPERDEDRIAYCKAPVRCPLLINHRCVAYAARPLACRTHFVVSSPDQCRGGDRPVIRPDLEAQRQELADLLRDEHIEASGPEVLFIDGLARALHHAAAAHHCG